MQVCILAWMKEDIKATFRKYMLSPSLLSPWEILIIEANIFFKWSNEFFFSITYIWVDNYWKYKQILKTTIKYYVSPVIFSFFC